LGNPASEKEAIKELQYGTEISIPAKERRYNVISIQVESLNSDIIDYEHRGQKVMPFLSSLRDSSIYYPRMVPQHRSGGSSDAEFALFNGIEALYGFPVCQFSLYEYPNSFLRQLKEYSKYAFHGNSGEYFNRNHNLPAMGFDTFFDIYDMQLPEEGWGASDEAVFDFILHRTESLDPPFYYHIITMSSHGPFNLVENYYQNELFDDVERRVEHDYLLSMNYVDQQLQYFIGTMREMAPDTYFFIYSDHSIKFEGDHYQPNSRTVLDGNKIEFVPLLIISPDDTSILMEEKAAAFLDLGLTVLEAAGVEARIRSFGDNLLKPEELNDTIVHFGNTISRKKLAELPLTPAD
jgi:phosphoglycerol transferase MdoB-like AlkP superfamily enzyme